MFEHKKIIVCLIEDAKNVYQKLQNNTSAIEHKGLLLLKSVNRAVDMLKQNPFAGIHIKKKLIPKKYILHLGISNLWKVNLTGYWRMLYAINQDEQGVVYCFIIEIVNHKDYDKIFRYKSK